MNTVLAIVVAATVVTSATEVRRLNLRATRLSPYDMDLKWNDMSWSQPKTVNNGKYLTTNRSCTMRIRSKMPYHQRIDRTILIAPGRTNCTLTGLTEGVYHWVQLTCTGVVGTEEFSDIDGIYITTPFSENSEISYGNGVFVMYSVCFAGVYVFVLVLMIPVVIYCRCRHRRDKQTHAHRASHRSTLKQYPKSPSPRKRITYPAPKNPLQPNKTMKARLAHLFRSDLVRTTESTYDKGRNKTMRHAAKTGDENYLHPKHESYSYYNMKSDSAPTNVTNTCLTSASRAGSFPNLGSNVDTGSTTAVDYVSNDNINEKLKGLVPDDDGYLEMGSLNNEAMSRVSSITSIVQMNNYHVYSEPVFPMERSSVVEYQPLSRRRDLNNYLAPIVSQLNRQISRPHSDENISKSAVFDIDSQIEISLTIKSKPKPKY